MHGHGKRELSELAWAKKRGVPGTYALPKRRGAIIDPRPLPPPSTEASLAENPPQALIFAFLDYNLRNERHNFQLERTK